jgi:hypothetical protein
MSSYDGSWEGALVGVVGVRLANLIKAIYVIY